MDAISAQNNYKQIIKSPLSDLSNFYYLYALYIFYGLSEDINVDYTRVYYWISKSADLGNVDALFYRGLLSHYKLDGTFNLHLNLEI